jgi:hypothetical protein
LSFYRSLLGTFGTTTIIFSNGVPSFMMVVS